MTTYDNKWIVRQYIDRVVNTGDLAAMEHYVADGIVDHNAAPDAPHGIEAYRQHLAAVRQTYGDFHLTIEQQVAEDDLVVTRVIATGVHQHAWLGIAPTGRAITITGINIDRVVNGKIVEHWGEANTLAALLQMGATIEP